MQELTVLLLDGSRELRLIKIGKFSDLIKEVRLVNNV